MEPIRRMTATRPRAIPLITPGLILGSLKSSGLNSALIRTSFQKMTGARSRIQAFGSCPDNAQKLFQPGERCLMHRDVLAFNSFHGLKAAPGDDQRDLVSEVQSLTPGELDKSGQA